MTSMAIPLGVAFCVFIPPFAIFIDRTIDSNRPLNRLRYIKLSLLILF